jgi:hypothetical protein
MTDWLSPITRGCGTEDGWQRHEDAGQAPCYRCRAAHAVAEANRRTRYRAPTGPRRPVQYQAALRGREPAEALLPADRELLVRTLVEWGWTDLSIAELTRMTLYTTCRIRERIGLPANQPARSAA